MIRMLTYGISTSANDILGCSLSPISYCICKKTAIANNAQEIPLLPFDNNRLVPVKVAGMTYGVVKKHHVILRYEDGTTIPGYDIWLEDGAAIPNPEHPYKEGWTANGWSPAKPSTATQDGIYTQQYSRIQYTITWVVQDGSEIVLTYYHGDPVYSPDPRTLSSWRFDGWNPAFVEGTPATGNARYIGQYSYLDPGVTPGEDVPHDDEGHSGRVGPDSVVYTMDNMGQTIDPTRIETGNLKPAPTSNIKNLTFTGDLARSLNVPEGTSCVPEYPNGSGNKTWWSGPMDGFDEDTHGEDNGISAVPISGRRIIDYYFWYDSDSCIYEYAYVDKASLPRDLSQVGNNDLVSEFTCPCYRDGQYIGTFRIHCDVPWIKIAIVQWNESPSSYDGMTCPFYVEYFIQKNDSSDPRVGTVTVSCPGGTCNYDVHDYNPDRNKPYITNGRVFFYQLGKE